VTEALVVLPDAEKVIRDYLLSVAQVTALIGQRVYTVSQSGPQYPYVTIQRFGGIPTSRLRIDSASIQVDCWGNNQAEASLVARTVRAALHAAKSYVHQAGVITGVDDELGLSWQPDTTYATPKARFVFGVAVHLHPVP
jgi:hypothetical protein